LTLIAKISAVDAVDPSVTKSSCVVFKYLTDISEQELKWITLRTFPVLVIGLNNIYSRFLCF